MFLEQIGTDTKIRRDTGSKWEQNIAKWAFECISSCFFKLSVDSSVFGRRVTWIDNILKRENMATVLADDDCILSTLVKVLGSDKDAKSSLSRVNFKNVNHDIHFRRFFPEIVNNDECVFVQVCPKVRRVRYIGNELDINMRKTYVPLKQIFNLC